MQQYFNFLKVLQQYILKIGAVILYATFVECTLQSTVTQTHRDKLALASIFTTYSRTEAYIEEACVYVVLEFISISIPCMELYHHLCPVISRQVLRSQPQTVKLCFFGIEVQYRGRVRDEPDLHCFLQTWSFSVTIDYVL